MFMQLLLFDNEIDMNEVKVDSANSRTDVLSKFFHE